MAAWLMMMLAPGLARAAEDSLAPRLDRASALMAQGRGDDCQALLLQDEGRAWRAEPALRNAWHRLTWLCMHIDSVSDRAFALRVATWMERWLLCCADEPGVDIRFRASTRVIRWVSRQQAGLPVRDEIDALLSPWVDVVLAGPAPRTPPPDPSAATALTELLLTLGEMGGHLNLEDALLHWRTHMVQRAGEDHVTVLAADKSLAFTARKSGRVGEATARMRAAWDRFERSGIAWPSVHQSLSSEMGAVLAESGRFAAALHHARLTQDILEGLDGRYGVRPGRAAYNRAGLALAMGDFETAREQALRSIDALTARRDAGSIEAEYPTQLLHQARLELGEPGAADDLEQALVASSEKSEWVQPAALRLLRHAQAFGDAARLVRMQGYLKRHMSLTKPVFHPAWVQTLLLQADGAEAQGGAPVPAGAGAPGDAADNAWRLTVQAVLQAQLSQAPLVQAQAWLGLAQRWQQRRALALATWAYKQSARQLLPTLGELSATQQAGLLDAQRGLLRGLQQATLLLVQQGRLAEAEALAAQLQLGEVRHYLRGGLRQAAPAVSASLPDNAEEARWTAELDALTARLLAERQKLLQLHPDLPPASFVSTPRDERRALHTDAREAWTAQWIEALRRLSAAATPGASAALPATAAGATALRTGSPGAQRAALIDRSMPPGTALLWWAVGEQSLVVQARTRRGQHGVVVPVRAASLARAVMEARQVAMDEARADRRALQTLHQLLLEPVEAWLRAQGVSDLRLRPPGSLMAVPFAALHRGAGPRPWLVQRYSLWLDVPGRPAQTEAAPPPARPERDRSEALGNPARLRLHAFGAAAAHGDLPPLPWVRDELRWIVRHASPDSRVALDGAFTWAALEGALLPPAPGVQAAPVAQGVHLASHFRLHPTSAELSYLQLGDGQRATLPALVSLPWQHSRLSVVSACDTATAAGSADGGVALNSLAHGLLARGSRAVVGTIWAVRDESMAHLMQRLYAELERGERAPAQLQHRALSRAQRQWLREHRDTSWAHPRHWAGVLWLQ